jgi:hypothetical protein
MIDRERRVGVYVFVAIATGATGTSKLRELGDILEWLHVQVNPTGDNTNSETVG